MITTEQLQQITIGYKIKDIDKIVESLNETFDRYDINTPLRQSYFLGQILHESGCFYYKEENLNYSAGGLIATFPKYFENIEQAKKYERQPEKIANYIYGNRIGNSLPGDGYKYRGRGFIQLTGRNNYKMACAEFKQDFLSNPDYISESPYNCLIAGWYWKRKYLNQLADVENIVKITRRINGGLNGLNDRIRFTEKAKKVLIKS